MALRIKDESIKRIKTLSDFGLGKSEVQRKKEEEESLKDVMTPSFRPPVRDLADGFSIEEGLNPWEIPMPTIPALLVCPTCKSLVDECESPGYGLKSVFARCPKCEVCYFIFELIKQKSWIRKF